MNLLYIYLYSQNQQQYNVKVLESSRLTDRHDRSYIARHFVGGQRDIDV